MMVTDKYVKYVLILVFGLGLIIGFGIPRKCKPIETIILHEDTTRINELRSEIDNMVNINDSLTAVISKKQTEIKQIKSKYEKIISNIDTIPDSELADILTNRYKSN